MGDVEEALASSEAVVEGSITTTRQEHFYEETNNVLVVPVGEDDEYKLYACTPNIIITQHTVAMTLSLPFNKIHVTTKRVSVTFVIIIIDLPFCLDWVQLWRKDCSFYSHDLCYCPCC